MSDLMADQVFLGLFLVFILSASAVVAIAAALWFISRSLRQADEDAASVAPSPETASAESDGQGY